MVPLLVDEPDRVEHLHRMVGVEARKDLRDLSEISVDELTQTTVIVNRTGARATRDEEFEVRDAERVLDIDGEEAETEGVLGRGAEAMLVGPGGRLAGAVFVGDPPDLADAARVEMCRERKLRHVRSRVSQSQQSKEPRTRPSEAWQPSRPTRPGRALTRSTPTGGAKVPYRNATRKTCTRGSRGCADCAPTHSTSSSRAFGRKRRPAFAEGRPSVSTTSAVKSFEPRISDEPTP